jgi:DNA-binding MarR family transcriptional regulator
MTSNSKPRSPARAHLPSHWRELLHDERLTHLIRTAFRGTSAALQRRLKEHGVAYGHWTFLRILWQTDGLTQRQLSVQAGVTEPSSVTALQAMEKLGYIARQKLPGNRKEVRIFLTPKGVALRPLIVGCAEDVNGVVAHGIAEEDLAVTRRTLLAVIDNLERDAAPESGGRPGAASRLRAAA